MVDTEQKGTGMDARLKPLAILIAVGTLMRLALAAWFPLGNDEAYHTLFLRHPQASYFDHPPMLMVVESVGMTLLGQSPETVTSLGARLGFIALFAGSTWLMFRLTRRLFGREAGILAAFALNLSAYHTVAAGTFALPDGPLLFFWLLTMDRLAVALSASEKSEKATGAWVQVGLAWGLAMLSKYHAVFLPFGAVLYVLIRPNCRRTLLSAGPWIAVLVGSILFSPVVWWNATHDWASFAFQSGRATGGGFNPATLAGAIGGQIAYLTPWIWWPAVAGIYALARGRFPDRSTDDSPLNSRVFLLSLALPATMIFLFVAARKQVLPHWSLVGLIPAFPLIGKQWADALAQPERRNGTVRQLRFATGFVVIAALFVSLHARFGLIPWASLGPVGQRLAKVDMTLDGQIWSGLTRQMKEKGWLPGPDDFIFTSRWYESGHLARELDPSTRVLCYNAKDSRGFADWGRPEDFIGRDGILVSMSAKPEIEPACYDRWFEGIEPLGTIQIEASGMVVRTARIYRCVRQKTVFPFDRRFDPNQPRRMIATKPEVKSVR